MARYDVEAAKKAGVPDKEIIDQLYSQQPKIDVGGKSYDVRGARDAGVDDAEIVSVLTRGRGFDRSGDPVKAFGRGVASGTAQILGLPVDLGVSAVNKIRNIAPETSTFATEVPELNPSAIFGGTESIKRGFGAIGIPTYERLEDLPPGERPLAAAGEVFGGGSPIAAAPIALGKLGFKGPKLLEPILTMARESPLRFGAVEAGGLLGSAQGAGISELYFPGEQGVRLGAEVVGGFLNPLGLVLRSVKSATTVVRDFAAGFTKVGREAKTAKLLQNAIVGAGEDPVKIAAKLREGGPSSLDEDLPGMRLTSGMKSGSPTLLAVEKQLARDSDAFGGDIKKRVTDSFNALRNIIDSLQAKGTPEALQAAARVRQQYFQAIVSGRLSKAQAEAATAWARVGKANAPLSGKRAHAVLEAALEDIRQVERELWDKIDRTTPMRPNKTIAAYEELRKTILPSETVDSIVEAEVKRFRPKETKDFLTGAVTTAEPAASSGDLLRLRSRMLRLARDVRSVPGGADKARQYTAIADGALDDLSELSGDAVDTARSFSREMNDSFSRTFAGDALGTERTGALKIDPELMLETAFGRGGTSGDIKLKELSRAAGFTGGRPELELSAAIRSQAMRSEQENFLRVAADATTDTGGRVNPQRLQDFMEKNEAILTRFPELRRHLGNAANAEQSFREMEKMAPVARDAIQKRTAFARILGIENVPDAIRDIIKSKAPERNYAQLVRVARRGGPEAVEGLKSATLEYAMRQSMDASGNFSFARYNEIMTRPVAGGKSPGVLEMLERQDILDKKDAVLVRRVLSRANDIEQALKTSTRLNDVLSSPDAIVDLVIRIVGSRVGAAGAMGAASGSSLVAAGAGVRFMRTLFDKIPNVRVSAVLEEVARNHEFAAALLERPNTVRQARALEKQINAFLLQAGLTPEQKEEPQSKQGTINSRIAPRTLPYQETTGGGFVRG